MDGLLWLALAFGCVALLAAACASEPGPAPSALGPPVVRQGVVYTPVSTDPRGCVLYRVSIPGGRAPAALMYRSKNGAFTYDRPPRCVTSAGFKASR